MSLADSGSVDDGEGQYAHHADCRWSLSCSDPASHPQLTFSSFDMEINFDFVTIYDGADTMSSTPELVRLSGTANPSVQVASGTQMAVQMTSDYSVAGDGFHATFVCMSPPPPLLPPGKN